MEPEKEFTTGKLQQQLRTMSLWLFPPPQVIHSLLIMAAENHSPISLRGQGQRSGLDDALEIR